MCQLHFLIQINIRIIHTQLNEFLDLPWACPMNLPRKIWLSVSGSVIFWLVRQTDTVYACVGMCVRVCVCIMLCATLHVGELEQKKTPWLFLQASLLHLASACFPGHCQGTWESECPSIPIRLCKYTVKASCTLEWNLFLFLLPSRASL